MLFRSQQHESVNHYYINDHYEGQVKNVLNRINDIAHEGVRYHETGDYGTQPDFYVSIHIGKWDRPFQMN